MWTHENRDTGYEMEKPAVSCDNRDFPTPIAARKDLTTGRVACPTRATAYRILKRVVENSVRMLDNTIAELTKAREAACRGEPLGSPNLGDVTACWLKYKLSVCIDDLSAWTQSTKKSRSVAEVIRRLVGPRELLAKNVIRFICDETATICTPTTNAYTTPLEHDGHGGVRCIPGTPAMEIHLCAPFWNSAHAPFREQTIIHEAVHLTHCGREDDTVGITIGSPECLAQFVVATNGKRLDPKFLGRCGYSKSCGKPPKNVKRMCAEA